MKHEQPENTGQKNFVKCSLFSIVCIRDEQEQSAAHINYLSLYKLIGAKYRRLKTNEYKIAGSRNVSIYKQSSILYLVAS